ncbi:caspase family protein [Mesorhizobium sp. KR9-304]|uniref:caspase family protein n=1 Tax=Mesorhizobium sp. KR9-304 TaxID=3156614 RepID=UPI0032B488F9
MALGLGIIRFAAVLLCGLGLALSVAWAGLRVENATGYVPDTRPRLALVIGIGEYTFAPSLKNSRSDAKLIAKTLIDLGFDTQVILDPTSVELKDAMTSHTRALTRSGDTISLVYYAGQGLQVAGVDYVLGAEAPTDSEESVLSHSVPLSDLINQTVEANKNGMSFFMIDASRDNPFLTSGLTRGLAPVNSDEGSGVAGTAILFATEAGQTALDGEGENSPFAAAVANALAQKNLDQSALFRTVRNAVMEATQGRQIPAYIDNSVKPVVLNYSEDSDAPEDDPGSRAAVALYEKEPGIYAPTYEDGSFALLIGVSDYAEVQEKQAWRDLPSVKNDVDRLGRVLEEVHRFEVERVVDPTGDELETALESFINRHGAKPNARLLIYLAGHGATTETFGRKTAWFVPADAPAMNPAAPFRNTALNLRRIEEWSETVDAKHVMWIFDSCFSGAAIRMIETRSEDEDDGWSAHLHANPVRRVLTAGSENEEVPADSIFTAKLIDVLSGKIQLGDKGMITGRQIGDFLREDIIRYNRRQGNKPVRPQSDTIVIPGEEGDIIFRIEPQLVTKWEETKPSAE